MLSAMIMAISTVLSISPEAINGWIDVFGHVFLVSIAIISALLTMLLPILKPLIPVLLLKFKDEKARVAVEAVTRAGLMGATRFAERQKELLDKAQDANSPGGTSITDEERKYAATQAALAGFQAVPKAETMANIKVVVERAISDMHQEGTLNAAVKKYGSLDEIKSAVERVIESKIATHPVIPAVSIPTPDQLVAPGQPMFVLSDPVRSPVPGEPTPGVGPTKV